MGSKATIPTNNTPNAAAPAPGETTAADGLMLTVEVTQHAALIEGCEHAHGKVFNLARAKAEYAAEQGLVKILGPA